MKWVETTRDDADVSVGSFVVEAAIRVIEIEDVFVARMACGGHICARELNIENFKEGISGTASITKSTSERESMFVVVVSSDLMLSDCSWVIRSFVTSFAKSFSVACNDTDQLCLLSLWRKGRGILPANLSPLSIEA